MDAGLFLATVLGLLFLVSLFVMMGFILWVLPRERGRPRNALVKDWRWYYVRWAEKTPNEVQILVSDEPRGEAVYLAFDHDIVLGEEILQGCYVRSYKRMERRVYEFSRDPHKW